MDAATDTKQAIRARMRAERLTFATSAAPIIPPPAFLDRLVPGTTIAGYLPMAGEADPALLIAAAVEHGLRVAMPHVTGSDHPMRFLAWSAGNDLEQGPFNLQQPRAGCPELTPDIILTPLVAFDRALNRLGQGAGYYDRAFAALSAVLRIGVAWSIQRVDALPIDHWDVPLHGVITELGWTFAETNA